MIAGAVSLEIFDLAGSVTRQPTNSTSDREDIFNDKAVEKKT